VLIVIALLLAAILFVLALGRVDGIPAMRF